MISSTAAGSMSPFSVSSDSVASTRSAISGRSWSCVDMSAVGLEIRFEQIDVNDGVVLCDITPQLPAIEPHGVQIVGVLAAAEGIVVGKDHRRMNANHRTAPAAAVGGEPGMPLRLMIARHDVLPDGEARRRVDPPNVVAGRRTPTRCLRRTGAGCSRRVF